VTVVNVKFRRINGASLTGVAVASGYVEFSPASRYDTTVGEMLPLAETVPIGSSQTLNPGIYKVYINIPDGLGHAGDYEETRYVQVPEPAAPGLTL